MPGVWKKTLTYLGLVEEDEFEQLDDVAAQAEAAPVRRLQRPHAVRDVHAEQDEIGLVRTIPSRRSTASSILAGSTRPATSPTGTRTGSR
jgi:hypothetical protein